jgi:PAS domain-containing protein
MSQKDIEVILLRQLASYLATPVFIVDPLGNLIFYNEPAEKVLGRRFEETGEMPAAEWGAAWTPVDEKGKPLPPEALPLSLALAEGKPSCRRFWIRGLDGVRRYIEAVAFPLIGQARRRLGAAVIFSEVSP